jgi:hypothetical protein
MNNKLIAIAVAGALSVPMAAQAGDVTVSGFVDTFYTLTNDGNTNSESQFAVDQVEVDVEGSGVRVDLDNTNGTFGVDQAYAAADIANGWSLRAGLFDSGITADNGDAPDMNMSTHSAVYDVLAGTGNAQFAGVSFMGMAGPASVAVSLVNDDKAAPDQATTAALLVSGSIMDGLDAELGYVSKDSATTTDVNLNYTMDALRVNLDYLTSDHATAGAAGYSLLASYDLGNGFAVAVRADSMTPENAALADETSTTVFGSYAMSDNMTLALESKSGTNTNGGSAVTTIVDGTVTTLEILSTF